MVSGQMTRGAAISMALLAIIVLALIVLLAWPTHSASNSPVGTDDLAGRSSSSQANIQVTIAARPGPCGPRGDRRHQAQPRGGHACQPE